MTIELNEKPKKNQGIVAGKLANKKGICEKFNLDVSKPLVSFIGRLVYEKGADLLPKVIYKTLLNKEVNIVILGSGDMEVEAELKSLKVHFKNSYAANIGYDEELAHQLYAASDFLLMSSRVEPCGLNQLYAMRYGTIPIVPLTGGLIDTVVDIRDGGVGICYENATIKDICNSLERAFDLYKNKKVFLTARKKCMQINHSWEKSSQEYLSLYQTITN